MYFYFKTRTAPFPIRHVNKTPQKTEVGNLRKLRGFIAVRWEYGQNAGGLRGKRKAEGDSRVSAEENKDTAG